MNIVESYNQSFLEATQYFNLISIFYLFLFQAFLVILVSI